jgi:hypothetical protein
MVLPVRSLVAVTALASVAACGRLGFSSEPAGPCEPRGDELAVYSFESDDAPLADGVGERDGVVVGTPAFTDGPPDCGRALQLADGTTYGEIPHDQAWHLDVGAVELWLRLDQHTGDEQGVLSRDAYGQDMPGHLTIMITPDRRLAVRLQSTKDDWIECSNGVVPIASWTRLGLNLGPPVLELWLDGVLQDGTGIITVVGGKDYPCGLTAATSGLAGNANPWVIGMDAHRSAEGAATPVISPLYGAVDDLRISPSRRSFATE